MISATRGVIVRGVLTYERLWSETGLLFHSHAILPLMVRPTPETGDDARIWALLQCCGTVTGRA